MKRYVLTRIPQYLLALWVAITINFAIPRLMPGSPTDALIGKLRGAGSGISPQTLKQLETVLGFPHGSILSQYWSYLGSVLSFNFGVSYNNYPATVSHLIGQALPWTLALVGTATVLAFVIGTLLGVAAAWRRNGGFDSVVTTGFTFLGSFPLFFTGLILLYLFAEKLTWFPLNGGSTVVPAWSFSFISNAAYHAVLPAAAIAIAAIGTWLLAMRNNMMNVLREDYVLFAQANGIPPRKVALRYAARNAILPNLTAFGIVFGAVVGGALLVEVVFAYPGIGQLLYQAVTNSDYALLQGILLVITLAVLAANFVVDMLYLVVDPRVRR
jgi:peptide/nickel transport system permease protein